MEIVDFVKLCLFFYFVVLVFECSFVVEGLVILICWFEMYIDIYKFFKLSKRERESEREIDIFILDWWLKLSVIVFLMEYFWWSMRVMIFFVECEFFLIRLRCWFCIEMNK